MFERVVQRIDPHSRLLRAWELKGGVSARVTALEIERPDGHRKKLVVRQHGDADLRQNPRVAADEFKLLQILQSAGLPAPAPYHLDESGEVFSTPYVVVEYIEGEPVFASSGEGDLVRELAAHLARIHNMDCSALDLSFLPRQEDRCAAALRERPAEVDASLDEGRIRDALESVWPLPRRNKSVLLHGDFWPGNILWRDGQLVGIIDWEDAALGEPLSDLANSRLEILWAFGSDAMLSFTERYSSLTGIDLTNLPYWDLWAALRPIPKLGDWGVDAVVEQAMREGLRSFIAQALEDAAAHPSGKRRDKH
ncbi:MAG TPA: phosphotransferase [Ardenticatenaceae bacterium]|nr:phosphotransferase [Ardenticatenaceae bacterium]